MLVNALLCYFLSYDKNNFHKQLQFCEGGTILDMCFVVVVVFFFCYDGNKLELD